jgi:hypothetical protein
MEYVRLALRYLHLVGFALLLGGWVVQYLAGKVNVGIPMRIGLGTLLGTGLLLAIPFPSDVELDYVKLGVKLAIAFGIGALFGIEGTRARAGRATGRGLFLAIGGLALLNAAVAVFWR